MLPIPLPVVGGGLWVESFLVLRRPPAFLNVVLLFKAGIVNLILFGGGRDVDCYDKQLIFPSAPLDCTEATLLEAINLPTSHILFILYKVTAT